MYSREESKKIRQEFWTSFGKNYPRKWLLYNTKIKDLSLKFSFNRRYAEVSIDLDSNEEVLRMYYFEKFQSLKTILDDDYIPKVVFSESFELENGKVISRIYTRKEGVNIHDRKDWPEVQAWLAEKMDALERFFLEYYDFIEQ